MTRGIWKPFHRLIGTKIKTRDIRGGKSDDLIEHLLPFVSPPAGHPPPRSSSLSPKCKRGAKCRDECLERASGVNWRMRRNKDHARSRSTLWLKSQEIFAAPGIKKPEWRVNRRQNGRCSADIEWIKDTLVPARFFLLEIIA